MSQAELIAEEMKRLPEAKLRQVYDLVHQLREVHLAERRRALAETAGCMRPDEADAFQQTIDDACERIDREDTPRLD
jgi:hypothetical protein